MRVCDITKRDTVETRYLIVEVTSDREIARDEFGGDTRVVHDWEVGPRAAEAIEKKDWKALNAMTPFHDRPTSKDRSDAARRAAATRKANREKATTAVADAPQRSAAAGAGNAATTAGDSHTATQAV
jgi:hypothetical protein